MGERTQYTPGTFCWTDLATTDQAAAKTFYSALFGWEATDNPVADGIYYTMMSLHGRPVAAVAPQPPHLRDAGAPPLWQSYVSVQSADATLRTAAQLGARVLGEAFDVMDVGRMGILQDPQGATFMVWEPRLHIGAGFVNGHGMLSWNELAHPTSKAHRASTRICSGGRSRRSRAWRCPTWSSATRPATATAASARRCRRALPPTGSSTSALMTSKRPWSRSAISAARHYPVRCRSAPARSRLRRPSGSRVRAVRRGVRGLSPGGFDRARASGGSMSGPLWRSGVSPGSRSARIRAFDVPERTIHRGHERFVRERRIFVLQWTIRRRPAHIVHSDMLALDALII